MGVHHDVESIQEGLEPRSHPNGNSRIRRICFQTV
jgi:hypothetical protein